MFVKFACVPFLTRFHGDISNAAFTDTYVVELYCTEKLSTSLRKYRKKVLSHKLLTPLKQDQTAKVESRLHKLRIIRVVTSLIIDV